MAFSFRLETGNPFPSGNSLPIKPAFGNDTFRHEGMARAMIEKQIRIFNAGNIPGENAFRIAKGSVQGAGIGID